RRRHRRALWGNEGDIMSVTTILLALIAVAVVAGAIWLYGRHRRLGQLETGAQATAARILEEARKEAEAIRKEAQTQARDVIVQAKADWEKEARGQRQEIGAVEQRIAQKEESIDRKIEGFAQREAELTKRED